MPRVTAGDRRLLFWAGSAVAVMCLVAVLIAGSGATAEFPSTYSSDSDGAKAAYLLLKELGYDTARWEQPPVALSSPERTTLILAEPFDQPTAEDRAAVQAFIERGGRMIATGPLGALFLRERASRDPIEALGWKTVVASAPSPVTKAAPSITISPASSWDVSASAQPLYGAEPVVVVQLTRGAGKAFWWAAPTPLTNAGLREANNLELLLASIGEPGERRVLFDEYFHGSRPTLAATVAHSPAKWLGVQLALVAVIVLLTYSRRSGPVLMPPVEPRLSPLEFARTLGSLYERAGAAQVPVSVALKRFRYDIARRLGLPVNAPHDTLARAAASRWPIDPNTLAAAMHASDSAASNPDLTAAGALTHVKALAGYTETVHAHTPTTKGTP